MAPRKKRPFVSPRFKVRLPGKLKRSRSLKDLPPLDDSLTLAQAVSGINLADAQFEDSAWRIGAYFAAIVDRKFPLPDGYVHAEDYVRSQMARPLAARMLRINASVARVFPESTATQYGVSKLAELISYGQLKNISLPDDPGPMKIDVVGKDGAVHTKTFAECTEGDLLSALHVSHGPMPSRALEQAVKKISDAVAGMARTEIERHSDHLSLAFRNVTADNKGELQNFVDTLVQLVPGMPDWASDSGPRRRK